MKVNRFPFHSELTGFETSEVRLGVKRLGVLATFQHTRALVFHWHPPLLSSEDTQDALQKTHATLSALKAQEEMGREPYTNGGKSRIIFLS
jgi:hypothetical protein